MQAHRGNIVVVEDDPSVNHAVGRLLEAAGFRARTFESAEALLSDETARLADCLVLDIHLPGMSGLELQKKLSDEGVSAPFIIITAHDDPAHRQAASQIGATAYLTKPFTSLSLIEAVVCAIVTVGARPQTS
jgi:FixJ family two-component response regulator